MTGTPRLVAPDAIASLSEFFSRPLAVPEEHVDRLVARFAAVGRMSAEQVQAAATSRQAPVRSSGGTAVIPVVGPIQPRADIFSYIGFAVAIEDLRAQLRQALADDAVTSIVFDFDSPGGDVTDVDEFAAEIFAANEKKPITAIARGWMASAAYYLGSQARELTVSPTAQIGSIGVLQVHADWSRLYDESGIKVTVLRTPEHKAEANPYEPLSDEARAYLQGQLNTYYGMFVDAVARGRKATAAKVRADFGGGRMVMAAEAVRLGMADRVATFDTVLGRHGGAPASRSRADESTGDEPTPPITTEGEPSEQHQYTPSTAELYQLARSR